MDNGLLNEEALKCPCFGINLDKLYHPVVLTLLACEDMHGYQLMKEVERRSPGGEAPDSAGIYRMLGSMEKMGLVMPRWETASDGKRRKVYSLTEAGRYGIGIWINTLKEYEKAIRRIVREAEKAAR